MNNAELIIDITSFALTIDINKFKVTFLTWVMYIPAFTPILTTADLLLRNAAMEIIK